MSVRRARGARRPHARSQHFLRSDALACELVRDAGLAPDALVLDLGAGRGRLTAPLARAAGRVLAVEREPELASLLRDRWPNVSVVVADATQLGLPREPFSVVANLPFAGTTAILRNLLDDPRTALVRADVVVEWPVAVRLALPWPSRLNSVVWRAWYDFSLRRRLPRAAFEPAPSVDAGVLAIERRRAPLVDEAACGTYRAFVAAGFRLGLRATASPRLLRRLGLARALPRDLDAHEWARLFRVGC